MDRDAGAIIGGVEPAIFSFNVQLLPNRDNKFSANHRDW
jgi:hypothetical protein